MSDDVNLTDREHVRTRPGMYIGDTKTRGLHQCVFELIDCASQRNAKKISVSLDNSGGVTLIDNGRSYEPGILEQSFTKLQRLADYQSHSGGLFGVGETVINFLAESCVVQSSIGGVSYQQRYCHGVPLTPVEIVGSSSEDGMSIFFQPDPSIFKTVMLQSELIALRLRELAFLRVGVRFSLVDERAAKSEEFYSEQGASDFVALISRNSENLHPVISLRDRTNGISFDIAFQYNTTFKESTNSFGNDGRTFAGGLHVTAFRRALIDHLKKAGDQQGVSISNIADLDTFFDGLTSVIAVRLHKPVWQGATKTYLANEELRPTITQAMSVFLDSYFRDNPDTLRVVLHKIRQSADSRKTTPPIDVDQFTKQQRRLTTPEDDPNGWGATAWFPDSYQGRMTRRNGGEMQIQGEKWQLFPLFDESDSTRTRNDMVERTQLARSKGFIPHDAMAIASNQQGDLLFLIRRSDRPCGQDYPNPYADQIYRWDHNSKEVVKIAEDFDEICWGPDRW